MNSSTKKKKQRSDGITIKPLKQSVALQKFFHMDELLSKVLEHCLPEGYYPSADPQTIPVSLTRVCSYWRIIALKTPELWARLRLVDTNSIATVARAEREAVILKRWLSRSGARPFSLHLMYDLEPGYVYSHVASLMSILATQANRLSELDLTCPAICLRPLFEALSRNGVLLKKLKVLIPKRKRAREEDFNEEGDVEEDSDGSDGTSSEALEEWPGPPTTSGTLVILDEDRELLLGTELDTMDDIRIDFTNLKSLQDLQVTGNSRTTFTWSGSPKIPLEFRLLDLRPIRLGSKDVQSVIRGLHLVYAKTFGSLDSFANYFRNLETLRIRVSVDVFSVSPRTTSSVEFPVLKRLHLELYSTEDGQNESFMTSFLPRVSSPLIEELRVDSPFSFSIGPEDSLPNFLRRSRPPLKSLCLVGLSLQEQTVVEIVKQCPVLSKLFLNLRRTQLSDVLLQSLTLTAGDLSIDQPSGDFCPLLKEVSLGSRDRFTADGVTDLVLSRNGQTVRERMDAEGSKQQCKLTSLRLVLDKKEQEKVLANPKVVRCMSDRLGLHIMYPY